MEELARAVCNEYATRYFYIGLVTGAGSVLGIIWAVKQVILNTRNGGWWK
jgi:hypothetical protein